EWVQNELSDRTGWVTSEYITLSNSEENNKTKPDDAVNEIVITTDNTHLRDEPSTNGNIIYFASKNESFTVLSEEENWYEIENNEMKEFVHQRLINNQQKNVFNGLRNKTIMLDAGHGGRD